MKIVVIGGTGLIGSKLVTRLRDRGYRCHELPMTEFLKAGGACKCLTMFMPQRDSAME